MHQQDISIKMKHIKFPKNLEYKRETNSRLENLTEFL